MHLTRIAAALALTAGLGITSMHAADASITATINITNNASVTVYHAKNPPSTQSDSFVGVSGWLTAPPDSVLAGASNHAAQITLGANQEVTFYYGSPNANSIFSNYCAFTVKANSLGNGFQRATGTPNNMVTTCSASLPSGQPYNVQVTLGGF